MFRISCTLNLRRIRPDSRFSQHSLQTIDQLHTHNSILLLSLNLLTAESRLRLKKEDLRFCVA